MKICTKCGQQKHESEFYKGRGACKACKVQESRNNYAPKKLAIHKQREAAYEDGRKRCKTCGELKSPADFASNSAHWDRLSHICKICANARAKQRYVPAKNRTKGQAYYRANRQKKLARNSEWRRKNPDASRAIWHRYRGRKLQAGGSFTKQDWIALRAFYCPDGLCLGCGSAAPLAADHVTPLAQGGSNSIANMQPLCQCCNSAKGAKRTIDYRPDGGEFARILGGDEGLHQPDSRASPG